MLAVEVMDPRTLQVASRTASSKTGKPRASTLYYCAMLQHMDCSIKT